MANSQSFPAIELQAPPAWKQSLASEPSGEHDEIASAAAAARQRAAEGFTTDDFRHELKRSKRNRAWKRFGIVVAVIAVIIAAAVAAVLLLFSVNQVSSNTMAPALQSGQVVVSNKSHDILTGDVVAYRDGSQVEFARVVAMPGSWVNIMGDGTLLISESAINNSSAKNQMGSNAEVKISRQLPSDSYFVLGDSESATISGLANAEDFITTDQVIGKTLFRVWPIGNVGPIA